MPFESLSYRHTIPINGFPERWMPLIHLYDPDLPLFPIYYFHSTLKGLAPHQRPTEGERVFGYIERIHIPGANRVAVEIITNKDLDDPNNAVYLTLATEEIGERLGLNNPVTINDIANAFAPPLDYANPVLLEIWHRVVANAYGNKLPFGRLWDEVLGLTRFVASWNSPGGRKGELIQTHYFASKFGERIQSAGGIAQIDFYLLPTINELMDGANPLTIFPKYRDLVDVAEIFQANNCATVSVGGITLSKFLHATGGRFNTAKILAILKSTHIPQNLQPSAIECYNTFDKGPQRTVIFLMMLSDLRSGRLTPATLSASTLGSIYAGLMEKTDQSPKVIHIYAQQSFGNASAIPIDIWIKTFFKWPFKIAPIGHVEDYSQIFSSSQNLGKIERLIWVTAQARKVHSTACNDAIWCIKKPSQGDSRGANPFACNICLAAIRNSCPAFSHIKNFSVGFNGNDPDAHFKVVTSAGNNHAGNQKFISCEGLSIYEHTVDDFSPADVPSGFANFPSGGHNGSTITVDQFINTY
jgi:hypothetical protein